MLQVVHRVITRFLLGQAGVKADQADSGAVTLIQPSFKKSGSAANLNIHLHCLVLDGVYRRGTDGTPEFVEAPAPTDETLQAVLHQIITRMMKLLTRRGVLVEEEVSTYMADNDSDSDEARALRQHAGNRGFRQTRNAVAPLPLGTGLEAGWASALGRSRVKTLENARACQTAKWPDPPGGAAMSEGYRCHADACRPTLDPPSRH